MNDSKRNRNGRRNAAPIAVTDAAGMTWGHANPAELYRWISRRNALLNTIGIISTQFLTDRPQPTSR